MPSLQRKTCHVALCLLLAVSLTLNARFFLAVDPFHSTLSHHQHLQDWQTLTSNHHRSVEIGAEHGNATNASTRIRRMENNLGWKEGCQVWAKDTSTFPASSMLNNIDSMPTGIAVTLAKRKYHRGKDLFDLLCQKIPTQQAYFYEPQGIDLLILIEIEGISYQQVADCLDLAVPSSGQDRALHYQNMDGTVLTVYKYISKTGRGRVFLAPFAMQYPEYIRRNHSRLKETMEGCDRGEDFEDYVQGTRYYSNDVLNLRIIQNYDYLLKVDLDVEFSDKIIPFHLLHDMKLRGAIFGHTGEFLPNGFGGCTKNINLLVDSFVQMASMEDGKRDSITPPPKWAKNANWRTPCSAGVDAFERGKDQYYTNFVVMSVDFFQSEHVRSYGKWMNEFYPGYFRYGWTDQLFFHKVMGLFLGPE